MALINISGIATALALSSAAPLTYENKPFNLSRVPVLAQNEKVGQKKDFTTYEQIETLRKNKDLDAAISLGTEYLKNHPDDVDVMLSLGLVYYDKSDYSQAEIYFNNVLKKSPSYLDAKIGLIRAVLAQKKYDQANLLIQQVSKEAPDNPAVKELQNSYANARSNKAPKTLTTKPESTILSQIKTLKKNNQLDSAIALGKDYLKSHPDDVDVMLYLGMIYYQKSNYAQAEIYFQDVVKKSPSYLDAKLGLIRVKLSQKKYQEAKLLIQEVTKQAPNNPGVKEVQISYSNALQKPEKGTPKKSKRPIKYPLIDRELTLGHLNRAWAMIEACLRIYPYDPDLIAYKAKLMFLRHLYANSANLSRKVIAIDPSNGMAKDLLATIKEIDPNKLYGVNEIGIASLNEHVTDLGANWDFSTLYYTRETSLGFVTARINYATRLGENAPQGEFEFVPIFNQYVYFDLDATFANKPAIFPKYSTLVEGYGTIPNFLTLSFGRYYAQIIHSTHYRRSTISLSKSLPAYWLSFRTNHYVPARGGSSTLYIGTIRRYFNTNDFYINFTAGYGRSPDLSDLITLNFLVIRNRFANVGVRFPICHHRVLVDLGVDYQNWKYPSGLLRQLYGVNAGLNFRF